MCWAMSDQHVYFLTLNTPQKGEDDSGSKKSDESGSERAARREEEVAKGKGGRSREGVMVVNRRYVRTSHGHVLGRPLTT